MPLWTSYMKTDINFRKNLYLCNNEPLKMDIGNLLHGAIIDAM